MRKLIKNLSVVICIVAVAAGVAGCAKKDKANADTVQTLSQEDLQKREQMADDLVRILENTPLRVKKWAEADANENYDVKVVRYFTTDMDTDGIPELWIYTWVADEYETFAGSGPKLEVYVLQDDGSFKDIATDDMQFMDYALVDGELVGYTDTHGGWSGSKFIYNNKKIFAQPLESGSDYDEDDRDDGVLARAQELKWHELADKAPLREAFAK